MAGKHCRNGRMTTCSPVWFGQPALSPGDSHSRRSEESRSGDRPRAGTLPEGERHAVSVVTPARARVESRRKQYRRILVVSVAVSAAIHAFLLSLGLSPPAATDGREATGHVPPTLPSAIRITGIVVAEPAVRPASPGAAAERVLAALTAPQPDVRAPVLASAPKDSAPKLDLGSPTATTLVPATLLSARSANPLLWRSVRDASDLQRALRRFELRVRSARLAPRGVPALPPHPDRNRGAGTLGHHHGAQSSNA